ncbi:mn-dependent transcriptional regulator [Halogeometricum borinquense DSM 11551]|uniref:Mn-dependent transcriptional regulator n=2 Tax=Halogeometricum borinquense TaxID=60847 RepID=E4NKS5_HALBP|nr:metal-dependent transcriptional regulator [Halogeometricum borinquense]ADQ65971.1 Mn-dependent transcriptional regulator [Halogeometricum borinquense DSM 11551]ELY23127.1 mn-dependent transcriptional regulator [Halogeometricum borinquense DSM 11551]RYJ19611.1 metal-dependent transcriptional regulator [Halogeometricum borinquense]
MSGRPQYLIALYIAEHRESAPVSPGIVASMLNRSSATAIETFHRLDDEGLVTYKPYDGAELTQVGRETAAELHDTYVTLSWFFRSVLELDDYESEAMEMAGVVSPDIADRLASTLPYDGDAAVETRGEPYVSTGDSAQE